MGKRNRANRQPATPAAPKAKTEPPTPPPGGIFAPQPVPVPPLSIPEAMAVGEPKHPVNLPSPDEEQDPADFEGDDEGDEDERMEGIGSGVIDAHFDDDGDDLPTEAELRQKVLRGEVLTRAEAVKLLGPEDGARLHHTSEENRAPIRPEDIARGARGMGPIAQLGEAKRSDDDEGSKAREVRRLYGC